MNENTQDIFNEIAKAARAAVDADTVTRRLLAGDIVHALASVYPIDLPPPKADAARAAEVCNRFDRFLTVAPGVTLRRFRGPDYVRLVASRPAKDGQPPKEWQIVVDRKAKSAVVEIDLENICSILVDRDRGNCVLEEMAIGALCAYLSRCRRSVAKCAKRAKKEVAK